MQTIYQIIAAILTRTPHAERVPVFRRVLDQLRCWGYDAAATASFPSGRHFHRGRQVVFFRPWGAR